MSLLEKVILDKNVSILSKTSDGRLMPLSIAVLSLAKYELNNSAFFVKLVKNKIGIDQYALTDT